MASGRDAEVESLLAIAKSQPEQALDRTVDYSGLRDSERPMWEAFDGDKGRKPAARLMR
jgi:hypothetical protein